MPDPFISPSLIPPGVSDQRSRDFTAALSALLGEFRTSSLLVQNPLTVDARMLPIMTIELGMSEFIVPGLREDLLRELLARAPDIHAMTGTVAGTRRALDALGVEVEWTQWWQKEPKGYHDTHTVTVYPTMMLMESEELFFSTAAQEAVTRVIRATKRWSQDIDLRIGVRLERTTGLCGAMTVAALVAIETKPFVEVGVVASPALSGVVTIAAAVFFSSLY